MVKINIKGPIVSKMIKDIYDFFGMDATAHEEIIEALDQSPDEDVDVVINSPGGFVDSGSEIYFALKEHKGKVNIKITAMAASIASVIAMAGDSIEMSPVAQMMIHNVSGGARGDYRDLEHESNVLKNYNKSISAAYQLKTGMDEAELLELMNNTTYMTAMEAKEKGFIDSIMFDDENRLSNSFENGSFLPNEVINHMLNQKKNTVLNNDIEKIKHQYNYLKLKGEVKNEL